MGQWIHRLSEINTNARTAVCSACGHVDIVLKKHGDRESGWYCRNGHLARKRREGKKRVSSGRDRDWTYNLPDGWYDKQVENQGGLCAICSRAKPLVVDHDHECCQGPRSCGRCVRGLICSGCNTKLGWYERHQREIASYLSSR